MVAVIMLSGITIHNAINTIITFIMIAIMNIITSYVHIVAF